MIAALAAAVVAAHCGPAPDRPCVNDRLNTWVRVPAATISYECESDNRCTSMTISCSLDGVTWAPRWHSNGQLWCDVADREKTVFPALRNHHQRRPR